MPRTHLVFALLLLAVPLQAQWSNRYKRIDGYNHHVYLEGYELPTMNIGPTAPAVSPDGGRIAFSARGWIWVLDIGSGRASRVTDGPHMDFRPKWSPDGRSMTFIRDDSRDTWIVVRELDSGAETAVNTDGIELDPVLGVGNELIYSPNWSASLSVDYRDIPLPSGWTLALHVDQAWVPEQFTNTTNTLTIPSYHKTNARITARSSDGKWRAAFYGTNVTNEEIIRNLAGSSTFYWHTPRQIGLEVGYRM